jgi:hypothetical protein
MALGRKDKPADVRLAELNHSMSVAGGFLACPAAFVYRHATDKGAATIDELRASEAGAAATAAALLLACNSPRWKAVVGDGCLTHLTDHLSCVAQRAHVQAVVAAA